MNKTGYFDLSYCCVIKTVISYLKIVYNFRRKTKSERKCGTAKRMLKISIKTDHKGLQTRFNGGSCEHKSKYKRRGNSWLAEKGCPNSKGLKVVKILNFFFLLFFFSSHPWQVLKFESNFLDDFFME
jgi:hypothetical protein